MANRGVPRIFFHQGQIQLPEGVEIFSSGAELRNFLFLLLKYVCPCCTTDKRGGSEYLNIFKVLASAPYAPHESFFYQGQNISFRISSREFLRGWKGIWFYSSVAYAPYAPRLDTPLVENRSPCKPNLSFMNLTNIISKNLGWKWNQERRIISRHNLNEYLGTLHLAPTQFCHLPGFYRKIGFLRIHPCPRVKTHVEWLLI